MKKKRFYKTRPLQASNYLLDDFKPFFIGAGVILAFFIIIKLIFPAKPIKDDSPEPIKSPTTYKEINVTKPVLEEPEQPSEPTSPSIPEIYSVYRVIDGDTIDVNINGDISRVRLIGVNTPESVHPNQPQQCFGIEASNYVKKLLTGQKVGLESDSSQDSIDIYGRLLRYVYLNNENINYKIIHDGYGYEYTYNIPYKYQKEFKAAQSDAANTGRGLWHPNTCNGRK